MQEEGLANKRPMVLVEITPVAAMRPTFLTVLVLIELALLFPGRATAGESPAVASQVRTAEPLLALDRGLCIDRQFRTIPPEAIMRITGDDIRLIKSLGFEFVKLIVNPEPLLSDTGLNNAKSWYLEEIVQRVVDSGLPVVVCIHPEWKFKETILSDPREFDRFVQFLEAVGQFLAARWNWKQLAFTSRPAVLPPPGRTPRTSPPKPPKRFESGFPVP